MAMQEQEVWPKASSSSTREASKPQLTTEIVVDRKFFMTKLSNTIYAHTTLSISKRKNILAGAGLL